MSNKKYQVRRQQEEEATAYAFQEFLETFQNSAPMSKTFIQSGVYNPGVNALNSQTSDYSGKVYAPIPLHKSSEVTKKALECARLVKDDRTIKPQTSYKPKSNLEELKEELQQRHKQVDKIPKTNSSNSAILVSPGSSRKQKDFDVDAMQNTTNLFLTNLNISLNEQDLMQIFGVYGPLASVKIMWPRVPDRNRSFNIGFVGYMSRKDCKRAYYALGHRSDMRISWGKPIEIPTQPIYIPPELIKMMLPPPYSGLPFNAQAPHVKNIRNLKKEELQNVDLTNTYVKVTIPLDKKILFAIHRTIEFVLREGPLMEAMIMRKELHNPVYQFLFENKSSTHVYYRWKLYSLLHGESIHAWTSKPFRMYQTGSIWLPPTIPDYTKGMVVKASSKDASVPDKRLLDSEQVSLIKIIQNLTPEKTNIAQAMVFCVSKIHAARDIVNILAESFESSSGSMKQYDLKNETRGMKQIARLYLISDILYNAKHKKYIEFVDFFTKKVMIVFEALHFTVEQYSLKREHRLASIVKLKIMKVLRAWEMWRIFPRELLKKLEDVLHVQNQNKDVKIIKNDIIDEKSVDISEKSEEKQSNVVSSTSMIEEIDFHATLVQSKWETQTPEVLQTQVMSTTRVDAIAVQAKCADQVRKEKEMVAAATSHNLHYDDLRRVEMKVIRYQDSLEGGKRKFKYAHTIEAEIDEYRKKCIKKLKTRRVEKELCDSSSTNRRYRR